MFPTFADVTAARRLVACRKKNGANAKLNGSGVERVRQDSENMKRPSLQLGEVWSNSHHRDHRPDAKPSRRRRSGPWQGGRASWKGAVSAVLEEPLCERLSMARHELAKVRSQFDGMQPNARRCSNLAGYRSSLRHHARSDPALPA